MAKITVLFCFAVNIAKDEPWPASVGEAVSEDDFTGGGARRESGVFGDNFRAPGDQPLRSSPEVNGALPVMAQGGP